MKVDGVILDNSKQIVHYVFMERSFSKGPRRGDQRFFEKSSDGSLRAVNLGAEGEALVQRYQSSEHHKLLEVPSDLEGMNVERVNRFISDLNLEIAPAVVVWRERLPEFQALGYLRNAPPLLRGQYHQYHDIAIVLRDENIERYNGPEYAEYLLAHELAHASSSFRTIVSDVDNATITETRLARSGFMLEDYNGVSGRFLEEAFAQYVAGLYIDQILQRHHGLADTPNATVKVVNPKSGVPVLVPSKYVYMTSDGFDLDMSSYPATALELLAARDPLLIPAVLRARVNVDGLREVAQRLDAIRPGLYLELRNLEVEDEWPGALAYVQAIVGRTATDAR